MKQCSVAYRSLVQKAAGCRPSSRCPYRYPYNLLLSNEIREEWVDSTPPSTDIFTPTYLEKRGWTGKTLWIDTDYYSYKYEEKVQQFVDMYNVSLLEDAVVFWCRENCTGRWDRFLKYGIEFENEEDAILFKLTWS